MKKIKGVKCQFHCHVEGDPLDNILYSPKELIKKASELNYKVLSITCHRKIIFSQELEEYAKSQKILLIPGIEFEIENQHILAINVDEEIYQVEHFYDLKKYRQNHPDSLIIAPHPYFPGKNCLGENLEKHIDLFDAIELSWAGTKLFNFNKKAQKIAKKYQKPLIATADCHFLEDLNIGYCQVESGGNWREIKEKILQGQIKNHHHQTSIFKVFSFMMKMAWQNSRKLAQKAVSGI